MYPMKYARGSIFSWSETEGGGVASLSLYKDEVNEKSYLMEIRWAPWDEKFPFLRINGGKKRLLRGDRGKGLPRDLAKYDFRLVLEEAIKVWGLKGVTVDFLRHPIQGELWLEFLKLYEEEFGQK